jgi:GTP cyclohydrolase II
LQVFNSPAIDTGETDAPLAPGLGERLARLRNDLSLGLPVVLHDADGAALVALIEAQSDARMAALRALGTPELVLTRRRAMAIGLDAAGQDGEALRFVAPDRPELVRYYGESGHPTGRTGRPTGQLPRRGPATQADRAAVALARASGLLPSFLVVRRDSAQDDAARLGLSAMRAEHVLRGLAQEGDLRPVSSATLPMDTSDVGHVHVFKTADRRDEHYAIEIGQPDLRGPVTVRLHSACFTGDVLGSLKCDCGPQLRGAMAAMADTGGVLLYLNQEGRGIGLANKMRAYRLQEAGFDTVEANHWLGFEDDERDFRIGARMLHRLGITRIRLMTNNPAKMTILTAQGIDVVERVPLHTGQTPRNAGYLATKAAKSGHLMP